MLAENQISAFRTAITDGWVLTPDDDDYHHLIKRWNSAGERRAAAIILAASPEDISNAVRLVAKHNIDMAIRGGGHSHFDASSTDGGVVIDLSRMKRVEVDEKSKTATVQGGALWKDVDLALADKGLASVGGTVNHTGVGGLTLGGGYGWLTGQYGLVIDNLIGATLVLADGSIVHASDTSHDDIFWAIRGGGCNFGIVVEFIFRAYDKPHNIYFGKLLYTENRLPDIVNFLNNWVKNQQPNETVLLSLKTTAAGNLDIIVIPFFDGVEGDARTRFSGLLDLEPVENTVIMRPYSEANALLAASAVHGLRKVQKGSVWRPPLNLGDLYQASMRLTSMVTKHPDTAGSALMIQFDHPDKINSVSNSSMAFANRGTGRLILVECSSTAQDPMLDLDKLRCSQQIIDRIKSWPGAFDPVDDSTGIYSNYATGDEDPRSIFGRNYERLARLKATYDPINVFNKWFPIGPAGDNAAFEEG